MNRMEDRLRDAYGAATRTVRPEAIRDLPDLAARRAGARPRPRRARLLIPLAAAAAVTAIVTGVAVMSPLSGSHPGQAAPLPPGVPTFYLEPSTPVYIPGTQSSSLEVLSTATGKVVGTVTPPPGMSFGSQAAALAGDRTFLVTASPESGGCFTEFYEVTLNDTGQPGPLTSLDVRISGFPAFLSLSVTPDGHTAAFAAESCSQYVGTVTAQLDVISLRTRQVRTWSPPPDAGLADVSLSADGRELAVKQSAIIGNGPTPTSTVRILSTSAPSGQLDLLSHVTSQAGEPDWAALSGDGRSLQVCSAPAPSSPPPTTPQTVTVTCDTLSLSSARQKAIASYTTDNPIVLASLDSSRTYLLIQEFTKEIRSGPGLTHVVVQSHLVIADLRTGQLTSLPPSRPAGGIAW